ncbi:MAG: hypothetical protein QHH75_14405 [Bacillota bacterium]|nr:hypothetical protein [Bacillota bacterium]
MRIGLKRGWKNFLETWQFWYSEQIRKNRLRSDYLKIRCIFDGTEDYWKDEENRLLLSVRNGEGRR